MKREQGKKASQKRLNLTPFVWGGGARSSVWRRQTRLKRHGKFTPNGTENLSQMARQIQAKFSQAKKAFFKS
ncbi:hypothetical protein INC97_000582 [Campylobacter upsaliensis]|nr:hypothetical protein [Campylobacter upsaliensis]